jgi:hypothetical protein
MSFRTQYKVTVPITIGLCLKVTLGLALGLALSGASLRAAPIMSMTPMMPLLSSVSTKDACPIQQMIRLDRIPTIENSIVPVAVTDQGANKNCFAHVGKTLLESYLNTQGQRLDSSVLIQTWESAFARVAIAQQIPDDDLKNRVLEKGISSDGGSPCQVIQSFQHSSQNGDMSGVCLKDSVLVEKNGTMLTHSEILNFPETTVSLVQKVRSKKITPDKALEELRISLKNLYQLSRSQNEDAFYLEQEIKLMDWFQRGITLSVPKNADVSFLSEHLDWLDELKRFLILMVAPDCVAHRVNPVKLPRCQVSPAEEGVREQSKFEEEFKAYTEKQRFFYVSKFNEIQASCDRNEQSYSCQSLKKMYQVRDTDGIEDFVERNLERVTKKYRTEFYQSVRGKIYQEKTSLVEKVLNLKDLVGYFRNKVIPVLNPTRKSQSPLPVGLGVCSEILLNDQYDSSQSKNCEEGEQHAVTVVGVRPKGDGSCQSVITF